MSITQQALICAEPAQVSAILADASALSALRQQSETDHQSRAAAARPSRHGFSATSRRCR